MVTTTSPGRLTGKVAIVTGAAAGIGRAIAIRYAREGAKVVCSDLHPLGTYHIRDEDKISTHDAITKEGGEAIYIRCDVGDAEEVELLVHRAVQKYGRLDILVNNAGIASEVSPDSSSPHPTGQKIHLTSLHTYDKAMRINARGTFLGCKYGIAQMLRQPAQPNGERGWVINIASIAGLVAFGGCPAYCSSKGAVVELTRQVAVDYGAEKIHVNAICPGVINTAMVKPFTDEPVMKKALEHEHPWGAFGEPEDVAGVAVFLASPDCAFVTGALLPVDGGYVAH
ncbi:hypothetical protein B0J14DRAFT_644243 [Halenospora varia]|nr:hypothetical protein B0J14DRAFT_644243 [Halenospora varia]